MMQIVGCVAAATAVGVGLYAGYVWWTGSGKEKELKETLDKVADRTSPEAQGIARIVQKRTAAIRDPKVREALPQLLLKTYTAESQKMRAGLKDTYV